MVYARGDACAPFRRGKIVVEATQKRLLRGEERESCACQDSDLAIEGEK